jgi:hypothetical protein
MKKMTMISVALLFFSGCFGYKPFQPPPDDQDRWRKSGATNTEIVKALLECGDSSPRARFNGDPGMTPNEIVLSILCMEASGFTSDFDDSAKGFCQGWSDLKLSGCQPGTKAPTRDVNRRLDSAFCHAYPKADVCIP